jgi:hypothetical protein
MTHKTKIITETDEAGDQRAGQTVFDYRLGKVEETVIKIDSKLDDMANNYITESTLQAKEREAALQHTILRDEIKTVRDDHSSRLKKLEDERTWVARIILGIVITAVLGLVLVTKTGGA